MEKKLSFEQALEKLEKIVKELEQGDVPLEKMVSRYEEGAALIAVCLSQLDTAEKTIKSLREKTDGSFDLTEFEQVE